MSKRKKITAVEEREFNVADFKVAAHNRDYIEEFLWEFSDIKEIGVKIRTPRIWVQGDEIAKDIWYYPIASDDAHYETQCIQHALSGLCQGWVAVTSALGSRSPDDPSLDVQIVFSDPDDLLLFKLTMPQ